VVRVIDFGQHEGDLYLVMELVEGPRLQDRIRGGRALALNEVAHLGAQLANGLAAAHAQGLVHRDLKPANVLIRDVDGRDEAVIIDFGLARLGDDESPSDDLVTRSNVMLGTPSYMSPEVVLGTPLDARSDLYALGVLLFRLVSGRLPFRGRTPLETITRHTTAPRPALESADRSPLPDDLRDLVAALLARDPAARPQTANEVARRLRALVDVDSIGEAATLSLDAASLGSEAPTPLLDPHVDRVPPNIGREADTVASSPDVVVGAPVESVTTAAPRRSPASAAATDSDGASPHSSHVWLATGGVLVAVALITIFVATPSVDSRVTSPTAGAASPTRGHTAESVHESESNAAALSRANNEVLESLNYAAQTHEMLVIGHALAVETERIARDTQPPMTPPDSAVARGTGALSAQANPWAQVLVDDEAIGETPIVDWPLTPGRYTVEFRYEDRTQVHDVRVRAGRTTSIEATFDTPP
jgi:serine/threonine protein kinase